MIQKQLLLDTQCFIDNSYLDEYIKLVNTNYDTFSGYSELHHVIPAMVYVEKFKTKNNQEARYIADKDKNNRIIKLPFAIHYKAHWLLTNCSANLIIKQKQTTTIRFMSSGFENNLNSKTILTQEELNKLQQWREELLSRTFWSWSPKEIIFLKDNYKKLPCKDLAKKLNKSEKAIYQKSFELQLVKKIPLLHKKHIQWKLEEIQQLKKDYLAGKTYKEIANKLNRSIKAVEHKVELLFSSKKKNRKQRWTEQELKKLKDSHLTGKSFKEIAIELNRSPKAIEHKFYKIIKN